MAKDVTPIKATTQEFLDFEDINDDLVLLSDGSCVMLVETTAVNFGLLSEKEQEALIYAYSGLLNSLSFPIQIYLRSKHKDITAYVNRLQETEKRQTKPILAKRIGTYRKFIADTVKERNVLDKKFYLVIPFSNLELGAASMSSLVGKHGLPYPKRYILNRAKTALLPKRDHILRQLNRLGLKGTQLSTQKLIDLFHDIYNPGSNFKPVNPADLTVSVVNKQPW